MISCTLNLILLIGASVTFIFAQEIQWIERPLMRDGFNTVGELECAANGLAYSVLHDEIYAEVFVDPSKKGNATVYSVSASGSLDPSCQATRRDSRGLGAYHEIALNYGECNIGWSSVGETFTYFGELVITTRVYSSAAVYRDFKIRQPFLCSGNATDKPEITPFNYADIIEDLPSLYGNFSVKTIVTAKSEIIKPFLNSRLDTQILTLSFELLESDKNTYHLLVDKCWGTVTADRDSLPQYEFLRSQGCVFEEVGGFVRDIPGIPYKVQVAAFGFDGVTLDQMHLHCEVNICRNNGPVQRCQRSCSANKLINRKNDDDLNPFPKYAASGTMKIQNDASIQPYVKIVNGRPVFQH